MTLDDLAAHVTTFDDPISIDYRGCRVWEMPPSGQGIIALQALNLLKGFDFKGQLRQEKEVEKSREINLLN